MIVGDDKAVLRNHHARAEALLRAAAAEHVIGIAEEVLEERIVGERRRGPAHHAHGRNIGDGTNRLRGNPGEIRTRAYGRRLLARRLALVGHARLPTRPRERSFVDAHVGEIAPAQPAPALAAIQRQEDPGLRAEVQDVGILAILG